MILGKVIGNVVSEIKEKGYESKKILIIQPIDPTGKFKGKSFLAIDAIQAGVGDTVLTLGEGGSVRAVLNEPDNFTVKLVTIAIVENINYEQ